MHIATLEVDVLFIQLLLESKQLNCSLPTDGKLMSIIISGWPFPFGKNPTTNCFIGGTIKSHYHYR